MRERDQVFLTTSSDLQACKLKSKRSFLMKHNLAGEPALKLDCRSYLKTTNTCGD